MGWTNFFYPVSDAVMISRVTAEQASKFNPRERQLAFFSKTSANSHRRFLCRSQKLRDLYDRKPWLIMASVENVKLPDNSDAVVYRSGLEAEVNHNQSTLWTHATAVCYNCFVFESNPDAGTTDNDKSNWISGEASYEHRRGAYDWDWASWANAGTGIISAPETGTVGERWCDWWTEWYPNVYDFLARFSFHCDTEINFKGLAKNGCLLMPCGSGNVSENLLWNVRPIRFRINFYNPIIDHLGADYMEKGFGTQTIHIYGYNFIGGGTYGPNIGKQINLAKLQNASGSINLSLTLSVVSDTECTVEIPDTTAAPAGTYRITLYRPGTTSFDKVDFFIVPKYVGKKKPFYFTKLGPGKYYSHQDYRFVDKFIEGRIQNVGGVRASLPDVLGGLTVGQASLTLADTDREIIKLIQDDNIFKTRIFVYFGFEEMPLSKQIFSGFLDPDFTLGGMMVSLTVRDEKEKYFIDIPNENIKDFYSGSGLVGITDGAIVISNEKNLSVETYKPETIKPLRFGSLTGVKTYNIDTDTNRKFLISQQAIKTISKVYQDGVEITAAGNWVQNTSEWGDSIIYFLTAKTGVITADVLGYWDMDLLWNNGSGYIDNPVRVIEFLLANILLYPIDAIDTASFDTVAAAVASVINLDLTEKVSSFQLIQEICFFINSRIYITLDGKISIAKIDAAALSTVDLYLTADDIINLQVSKVREVFNQIDIDYKGSTYTFKRADSIAKFGLRSKPIKINCINIDSADLPTIAGVWLDQNEYRSHEISFDLALQFYEQIDIAYTLSIDYPYGFDSTGRYTARKFLVYDLELTKQAIKVKAIDLDWI